MTPSEGSVRAARTRYFAENGFGDDGGYGAKWVKLEAGPLRFGFPNTPARVRAVRYHDLHHVLTRYATDWKGEAEIAAWEIASSCAGFAAAWVLNAYAMTIGLFVAPRAVWRAFLRGRHTRNLYRTPLDDALLDAPVADVRHALGLDAASLPAASAADRARFAAASGAGVLLALATLAVLSAPLVLLAGALGWMLG